MGLRVGAYDATSYKGDSDEARMRHAEFWIGRPVSCAPERIAGCSERCELSFETHAQLRIEEPGISNLHLHGVAQAARERGRESDSTSAGAAMSSATEFPNT